MPDALLHAAAFACAFLGMAWLALAMDTHWEQVSGGARPPHAGPLLMRVLAVAALAISLLLCLAADHPTMAPLVWLMALAASALGVAMLLAYKPGLLRGAVPWLRAGGS